MRRLAFDRRSLLLALAAIALYYTNFYATRPTDFAIDITYHEDYVKAIAATWKTPLPNLADAPFRHPPLYYWMGALLDGAASAAGMRDPIRAARHVSMAMYLVFILFGMLTLRELLPDKDAAYYAPLSMLLFWPVGVTFAGRITCDIMMYAAQMGTIYFLVCWLRSYDIAALSGAFVCAGFSILAKDAGLLFIGITGCCLLAQMWIYRGRRRELLRVNLVAGILFALLCMYLTLSRVWLFAHGYIYPDFVPSIPAEDNFWGWLRVFTLFDPLLFLRETIMNVHQGDSQLLFWQWFMRSLLFGDFIEWRALSVIYAGGIVWLALLLYMLFGLCLSQKATSYGINVLRLFFFVALVMIGAMMFMRYRVLNPAYADARYCYPVVAMLMAVYGMMMTWHKKAGNDVVFRIGNGLGAGMVLISVALFIAQHFLLTHLEGGSRLL